MENREEKQVALVVRDLIFETKIKSTAQSLGISATTVRSATQLSSLLGGGNIGLIIVDLNSAGQEAFSAIQLAKAAAGVRVIAYVSHVDVELASKAQEAGADEVMPRSRFTTQLPALLAHLSATGS